ncbi:MAG TPA: ABC transporter ATP-binding protein [Candidatus Angelobacter sp.]|nr:ABC transporter ATP-binding protein [Candidatus Angelobacter sp.]
MTQERQGSGTPPRVFGGGHGHGQLGRPVQKPKDFKGTLKRLLAYLKPHRFQLMWVVVMAILSTAFSIVSPKILGFATTKIFEGSMMKLRGVPGAHIDFAYILNILLILLGLYVMSAIFGYFQQYIMAGVAQRTVYDLRKEVDEKLFRLPLRFFDQHPTGDILSRVTNDVDNISSTLQQSLTQLITSIVTLIGILVMMLSINFWLTLLTFITLPLSLVLTKQVAKRSQGYFKDQQKALGMLNGHVEEMVTGHTIVKAFGREKATISQFNHYNKSLYESGWRAQFVSGIIMPLMMFIGNIGYVLIAVVGGIFVTGRLITIGDVQAFLQYSRQFSQPITQVANIANVIQSTIASAERVFELLDETKEVADPLSPIEMKDPQGNIEFNKVTFQYKKDVPLIENLTIQVKQGQKVAIVGPTGAGKTTLVNLLMRFYEVDQGEILIDGVSTSSIRASDLRQLFGMVLQDTWLFNGTIRDNIAYGKEGATEAEIMRAAKAAGADSFIRTLPEGYNTRLNEETSNLSQGQKQLLTIARAFLADPAFLILDEATSSVDTRTEMAIQKAMEALMTGRTSFVIAHRLSTIRDADLILVMNEGQVIEQGSHLDLLEQKGFYADLYYSQFRANA